jgi:hypothetical protein
MAQITREDCSEEDSYWATIFPALLALATPAFAMGK